MKEWTWQRMRERFWVCLMVALFPFAAQSMPLFASIMAQAALTEIFNAPLNTNGLTAADPGVSWPVTGVTAADEAWWCSDMLGATGYTTTTLTETGSIDVVASPFCPDGSHGDLTSGCLDSCYFDGTNDYLTSNTNGWLDINSSDATMCVVFRAEDKGLDHRMVDGRDDDGTGDGMSMDVKQDGSFRATVKNEAATTVHALFDTFSFADSGYLLGCGTSDYDGNLSAYVNGNVDEQQAGPGGAQSAADDPSHIGSRFDGGLRFQGHIVAVFFWRSLLDSTDMEELHEYFFGLLDDYAAPVAFTQTGNSGCFVDGKIEFFTNGVPRMGCELPTGWGAGAGSPSSGVHMEPIWTSGVSYTIDMSSWSSVSTPTVTATSTDLFRDRQTYRVCDADGASAEGVKSPNITITGLDTSDPIQVCVYAKDSSGTVLDLQMVESGVCGGSTTDYAAKTINSTWTFYEWAHTVQDGTCTTLNLQLSGADWGNVANTGCAEFVVQVNPNAAWCSPGFLYANGNATSGFDDVLPYNISGTDLASGANGARFCADVTPTASTAVEDQYLFELRDSGTANDYYRAHWETSDNKWYVVGRSTEEGSEKTMYTQTSAWSPTAGTTYRVCVRLNSSATSLTIGGVSQAGSNATLTNAPDSLDDLYWGSLAAGTSQWIGWIDTTTVEVP